MRFVFASFVFVWLLCAAGIFAAENTRCPRSFGGQSCQKAVSNISASLHEACESVPFASGCTVHRSCHEHDTSTKSCAPLNAFLAVCLEFPEVGVCKSFEETCGKSKRVLRCRSVIDLRLPSSAEAFDGMQKVCQTHYMRGCDFCDATKTYPTSAIDFGTFADDCGDPFGTFAGMCMAMDMIPCDFWKEWCKKESSQDLPGMCEKATQKTESSHEDDHDMSAETTHSHHDMSTDTTSSDDNENKESTTTHEDDSMEPNSDHASHSHAMHTDTSTAMTEDPTFDEALDNTKVDCIQQPQSRDCVNFVYPERSVHEDIRALCVIKGSSMPWMPGCSLHQDCLQNHKHDSYCSPFRLLATLCADMPVMGGCRTYNVICGKDSRIKQCHQQPAIPMAPRTMQTQRSIIEACSTHSMPQCSQCPALGERCGQTLKTMSELCFTMPSMDFCTQHQSFCDAVDGAFPTFCDAGSGNYLPPMRMYFHTGQRDIILFRDWIPESTAGYTFSFLAIVIMGVIVQLLKLLRSRIENSWYRQIIVSSSASAPSIPETTNSAISHRLGLLRGYKLESSFDILTRNIIRALLTVLSATFDFALMLVAMTFNVGLFIAVITGLALGMLVFGHLQEKDYKKTNETVSVQKPPHPNPEYDCCA